MPDQRPPAVQQSLDTLSSSTGAEKDDFGAAREGDGENKPGAPLIIPWRVKGRALVMVLLLNREL